MRQYVKCEICAEHTFTARLIGGRATYLCRAHANEYHEFIFKEHPEAYANYHAARVALDALIEGGRDATVAKLQRKIIEMETEFYSISDQWVEDQITLIIDSEI